MLLEHNKCLFIYFLLSRFFKFLKTRDRERARALIHFFGWGCSSFLSSDFFLCLFLADFRSVLFSLFLLVPGTKSSYTDWLLRSPCLSLVFSPCSLRFDLAAWLAALKKKNRQFKINTYTQYTYSYSTIYWDSKVTIFH